MEPINYENNPYLLKEWFLVINDEIGGMAVATVDRPTSEIPYNDEEKVLADIFPDEAGQHIVKIHNEWLRLYKGFNQGEWSNPNEDSKEDIQGKK